MNIQAEYTELAPGRLLISLTNEPGVQYIARKKGHLTLLRRINEPGTADETGAIQEDESAV